MFFLRLFDLSMGTLIHNAFVISVQLCPFKNAFFVKRVQLQRISLIHNCNPTLANQRALNYQVSFQKKYRMKLSFKRHRKLKFPKDLFTQPLLILEIVANSILPKGNNSHLFGIDVLYIFVKFQLFSTLHELFFPIPPWHVLLTL